MFALQLLQYFNTSQFVRNSTTGPHSYRRKKKERQGLARVYNQPNTNSFKKIGELLWFDLNLSTCSSPTKSRNFHLSQFLNPIPVTQLIPVTSLWQALGIANQKLGLSLNQNMHIIFVGSVGLIFLVWIG